MLYAQDLVEGQQFQLVKYTITEAEILQFANQYDPVSIHTDPVAAAATVLIHVRFQGNSGHRANIRKCPLVTLRTFSPSTKQLTRYDLGSRGGYEPVGAVMQTIWNLVRRNAGIAIALGLILFGTDAARTQSIPLYPNFSVIVPPTSLGMEPDLAPKQYWKFGVPFAIMNAAGAVECAGILQQIMVRAVSNRYHFYYRIRTTSGNGAISRIGSYNVGGIAINVAYRKDLRAGNYSLTSAGRSPWGWLSFMFYQPLSCAYGDTTYLLVKSSSPVFQWGITKITTTTGNSVVVSTRGP